MPEYIRFEKKVKFLGVGIQPVLLLDDKPVLSTFYYYYYYYYYFFFNIIKADLLNLKM